MKIFKELISQPSDVLKANPMIASSPPLTKGLDANKKWKLQRPFPKYKLPKFGGGKFKANVWYATTFTLLDQTAHLNSIKTWAWNWNWNACLLVVAQTYLLNGNLEHGTGVNTQTEKLWNSLRGSIETIHQSPLYGFIEIVSGHTELYFASHMTTEHQRDICCHICPTQLAKQQQHYRSDKTSAFGRVFFYCFILVFRWLK